MIRPPLRRRYSVTSISPNSSPSHSPPSKKRLQSEFMPTFEIRPKNWNQSEDLIFDGLVDGTYRFWFQNCRHILGIPFLHDSWSSNFIDLGFSLNIVSLLQQALRRLEDRYSSSVVWDVMQLETVGRMAVMILEAEVI